MDAAAANPQIVMVALAGIIAGLWLLARGFGGYRLATRIGDTGTSRIGSMAAGEVRLAGVIEPAEITLVSPLQSQPCVYYRATISGEDDLGSFGADLDEERAVGFAVRDETGSVRIFPRGARWDAPVRFDDKTGSFGEEPPGLAMRTGSAIMDAEPDVATAVAALLTVRTAGPMDGVHPLLRGATSRQGRRYEEARLEPGDAVTVVGRAMPFGDLADPTEADVAIGSDLAANDPEVAADIAEARAAGLLADDPQEAWGNAAIPGFGIGRPVRAPELDPAADAPTLGDASDAARAERRFSIAAETLVLASAPDVPLLIVHGVPGAAADRHQDRFLVGLAGAILAIASAMGLAILLAGGFGA